MALERAIADRDYFPSFGGLKSFYGVALTGSAVKAAARLGVTPSAISHQIKALETELGARLIQNRRGKLYLTVDGAQFFDRIKGPMSDILRATEIVRSTPDRKRVTLTLTPSFAADWLMHRLRDLEHTHPDLEINLITTTKVVDLSRENVDLAIRRGSGDWPGYLAQPLLREIIVPVMAPGLAERLGCATLEAALNRTRALVNTTVDGEWDKWCRLRNIAPPEASQRYNLETYELTVKAAVDELGIALGRRPLIDPLLASGVLVQPFRTPDAHDTAYYIVRRDEPMTSDVKRLHGWLLSQAG
ncbi:MAG: LysR substrate-binding domain-containing protein [Pseudomonadota bacterium]